MATTTGNMDAQAEMKAEQAPVKKDRRRQPTKIFRKGSKGSENTVAPPLPPRLPNATGTAAPTRLSTTATKPRNEPMFSDIDMMGFPGVEYDIIATQQPYFAKSEPKSAWVYYCVMSLYARLITLKQEDGDSTYDEDSFAGQILSGNHQLPGPIEAYIKALGNVVDGTSVRY